MDTVTKYRPLNELEAQHKVDLGTSYNNNVSAKCFTHYIAESQRKAHKEFVEASVPFFSFLMDRTTDVSKMEDEAVVMMYCRKDNL